MTRERAKSELMQIYGSLSSDKQRAIDTLLEQEPCEDAISRHKAIVMITAYEGKSAQIEALEQLPSVQPSRKGHWIKESPFMLSECSECGNKAFGYHGFDETRTDFCPNCGAKMESKE